MSLAGIFFMAGFEYGKRSFCGSNAPPKTVIATAALQAIGAIPTDLCRTPEIMADAAYEILTRPSRECTGNFFIDEEVLSACGISDFESYAVDPHKPLLADLFIE
jgi:citronellol/citronellal dehydrogenase